MSTTGMNAHIDAPGGQPPLRPLTGVDEMALTDAGTAQAHVLLSRLLDGADVSAWSVCRIDRALAALYEMLYGPRAECRASCGSCGSPYEFTLDLPRIIEDQDAGSPGPPDSDGSWKLPGGARVRAPRPGDLAADADSLAERLIVEGEAGAAEVDAFLEHAAPVLTLDLEARCPDCGESEQVRFDLATYLTRRLVAERPFLLRETHLIASRYGWPHREILALTREDRRAFAGLIEAERARLTRRRTA